MPKTPDEIKKGLECCKEDECFGDRENCPYTADPKLCVGVMCADALALIQQLEKRVIHLEALNQSDLTTITMQERTRARLQERISQLEAERDALHEGLKAELGCYACKHYVDDPDYDSNECMDCGKNRCNFEWRGVTKEDSDA